MPTRSLAQFLLDSWDSVNHALRVKLVGGDITITNGEISVNESGVGQPTDAAVTDPTASASLIALDKGVLSVQGTTTDAAVVTDANGSHAGKLRGLVKIFADVWVSATHVLSVRLFDGANSPAIKAASTAAIGTDPSLTVALSPNSNAVTPLATESHLGEVGGAMATPSATFTRPADTTAYAVGDLVANNTVAASVVPFSWTAARVAAGSFLVRRARIAKSGTSATNASFRLHLYTTDPSAAAGITNGDNGVWLTKTAGYIGSIDVTIDKAFSDGSAGTGVLQSSTGSEISVHLASGQTLYGLLEARAAYTPANAETFTVVVELLQN
jgi:hypothetical protein